ncbi:MAG: dihydroneopterin aldolase [Planctomycetota bacterium]
MSGAESPPDLVEIHDLSVRAIIGIFDFERNARQEVRMNFRIETDISAAAASDAIEDALDYKTVAKRVIAFVEGSSFFLLETLAEQVAALVLEEPRARAVELRVEKPGALRHARSVGLRIHRRREETTP